MASFGAQGQLFSPPLSPSPRPRRRLASSTPALKASSSSPANTVKCDLSSSPQNPESVAQKKPHFSISQALAFSAGAAGIILGIVPVTRLVDRADFFSIGGGGGGGNGNGGGGGGGGGGDGDGGFWSRIFSPAAIAKDEESPEWDSHGLPANIVVQLNKLSGFKKYKVSEILFYDRRRGSTVGTEDSFFEMVTIRPGGIYNKAQLQKELENLATCGMFEKVDLEAKTKPDGTVAVMISFLESTWQAADKFRCINVGLMPQTRPIEMDPDMTDKEKMEYFQSQEKDYKRRIDKSRPCMLPMPVYREIRMMLADEGTVSARLLQKIRDRVQRWYHDEGYACAQVVNFGNLNTREVVCEVVEGDITQLLIIFQDKLGNVVEGNTQLPVVRRELPKQVNDFTSLGYICIVSFKFQVSSIKRKERIKNFELGERVAQASRGFALLSYIKLLYRLSFYV